MFTSGFRDKQQIKPTLRDLQSKSGSNLTPAPIPAFSAEPVHSPQPCVGATLLDLSPARVETPPPPPEVTLTDVFVPLESIKPSKRARWLPDGPDALPGLTPPPSVPAGSLLPVTVFDGHSLRVLFHFARNSPPSRPDVLVVIISMLSSAPVPVTGINFRVTAPKVSVECLHLTSARACTLNCPSVCVLVPPQSMAVKLQPPSGTELPAFNPILPPAAVTQILLLANPNKVNPDLAPSALSLSPKSKYNLYSDVIYLFF